MNILTVDLDTRSYPITIGQGLLGEPAWIAPYLHGQQVLIVTNETIAPLYLEKTLPSVANVQVATVILPDGEEYKTLEIMHRIFDTLLAQRFDRQCTLVALGGGVIGDITGFAAACYQRGVAFIQIPTTLLAQVDSSVGGKTGVNHPLGKNMIGAFHQPQCVVIDTDTLSTLEDRQLAAGLAEVVKYALINDFEFFEWLEQHAQKLLTKEAEALNFAIARCCQNKANIVTQDERESGIRALLNLGHTFGHAIETGAGYGHYLHGEAVAIGLRLSASLSAKLGWLSPQMVHRIVTLLQQMQLPTTIPQDLSVQSMLELMKVDKKVKQGKIRLILLKTIGQAQVIQDYPSLLLTQTLEQGYQEVVT
jgi:3-dehydroquinate synthase